MRTVPYHRNNTVAYARQWALSRNPAYFNFETLGGDCTNFASQCIYAGAGQRRSWAGSTKLLTDELRHGLGWSICTSSLSQINL